MYHRNVGDALIDGVIEVHESSQPEPVRHSQPLPTLLASVGTSSAPPPQSLSLLPPRLHFIVHPISQLLLYRALRRRKLYCLIVTYHNRFVLMGEKV